MSNVNDFLTFCLTDTGTNLLTESQYTASSDRTSGNKPGVASSKLNNKAIRQSAFVTSQIAQFISNTLAVDVLDDATPANILAQIGSLFNYFTPTGAVIMHGAATAPAGWILCDGSSLLRAGTYAALFAVIGTTYGAADGTHFNVPDARGVFVRGAGTQTISSISHVGTRGTTQNDQMQGHYHDYNTNSAARAGLGGSGYPASSPSDVTLTNGTVGAPNSDGTNGTPRTGAETRPANIVLSYIIKI